MKSDCFGAWELQGSGFPGLVQGLGLGGSCFRAQRLRVFEDSGFRVRGFLLSHSLLFVATPVTYGELL